jgi:hypothetical protein
MLLVGLGLVAEGAGVGLGVVAINDEGDANDACPTTHCSDKSAVDLDSTAQALSTGAWVSVGVGAAALTTGIILIALPDKSKQKTAFFRIGPAGVLFSERFE